ncbi:A-kinase anchor protein 10, mitochondrial [Teleopsis dalmanni]|uniref:A-kinase anchor protein 10, mitochondrial n=1 Tax=Teleopsis dalmanni TaxID=139649 RepID=UPI0018CC7CEA|nr:A-kinase anchor protein 10, mitochondrial [Teleopsis dalmanni]
MLKLFKRQKSRRISSSSSIDGTNCDVGYNNNDNCTNNNKRHSLRSTSSFCDEVLEELAGHAADEQQQTCDEDVASIGGGLSLGSGSICTNHCNADEDIFKYQSRLSISLESIVNDQKCLSYFVQYLETKNALSLIKFYLDTENFKTAALAQLEKSQDNSEKHKCQQQDEPSSSLEHTPTKVYTNCDHDNVTCVCSTLKNTDETEDTEQEEEEQNNVPELKTLYDLSMRKPLTDDEKSQIYAETNKQISKSTNQKFNSTSELSLCSESTTTTEPDLSTSLATSRISAASTKDAIVIYQKYLIANAVLFVSLPVALLSQISLLLCKRPDDKATVSTDEIDANTSETAAAISTCCFDEAQQYVLHQLDRDYSNDFLQSTFYCKYCIELIEGTTIDKYDGKLTIYDILYSEVALFFFMEYLEQRGERDCLDFWTTAINFRKSYSNPTIITAVGTKNESEIQADAMIIYERFFSLQSECRLWLSDKLRSWVEERICAEGYVAYCFDLPLQITARYLEQKYFSDFLNSQLFENYVNELKTKIHEDSTTGNLANGLANSTLDSVSETVASASASVNSGAGAILLHKLSLRRTNSKTQNCHRKALSDCTNESTRELFKHISQQNTLLAMDSTHLKHLQATGTNLSIDARHLTNPNLLWHRSTAQEGGLKFGSVNALGRYERDFEEPYGSNNKYNWSLAKGGTKIKNAMRKLVNLPEEKVQEEIAWQVAEMIVKDVTSVTLSKENATKIWP